MFDSRKEGRMWSKSILFFTTTVLLIVQYGNIVKAGNTFKITKGPLHNMVGTYCTAMIGSTYFIPLLDEHLMIVDHYCNDMYECSYVNKSTNLVKGRMYNCEEGGNGPNGWVYPRKFGMVVAPGRPKCVRRTTVWPHEHPCGTKSAPTEQDFIPLEELEMEQEQDDVQPKDQDQMIGIAGPQCDLETYPSPYVRVLQKRNGAYIETLEKSGFMDLTKYIHKIICINGPSIIYQDVRLEGPRNESRLFHDVEIEVYSHQCVIINQISTAKAIQLRDANIYNPTLYDVDISEVIGKMATGIYLVSEPLDYYLPTSVMLIQNDWEYIVTDDDIVRDASFVTVGAGPFCLSVNDKFDIILSGENLNDTSVCKWTMSDSLEVTTKFRKRYNILFNGTVSRQELTWRSCGSTVGGSSGGPGLGPFPTNLTLPTPPPAVTTSQLDPFSIINPKFLSSRRLKSSKQNGFAFVDQLNNLNDFVDDDTDLTEDDLHGDFLINLDPSLCTGLRAKLMAIDPSCNVSDVEKTGGDLLKTVLTIEEADLKLPSDLEWKESIMDLVSEIFGKICEPFALTMPFTIARVMAYYLAKAHKANADILRTERDVWKF